MVSSPSVATVGQEFGPTVGPRVAELPSAPAPTAQESVGSPADGQSGAAAPDGATDLDGADSGSTGAPASDNASFDEYGDSKVVRGTKEKFSWGGGNPSLRGMEQNTVRHRQYRELSLATSCTGGNQVSYNVSAIDVNIPLNKFGDHDQKGRMYVLDDNVDEVRAQEDSTNVTAGLHNDPIQPLVIRANLGQCVSIHFTNKLDETASIHVHRGTIPPGESGSNVGNNQDTMVAPGGSTTYSFQIGEDKDLEGTWYMHSHGNREQVEHGLFGALMVEPKGSVYLDPHTQQPQDSGWAAIIDNVNDSVPSFREFAIFYHTVGDDNFQPHNKDHGDIPVVDPTTGVYRPCTKALNYRSECHLRRMELLQNNVSAQRNPSDLDESLGYSTYTFGEPATPMPKTYEGDPTKFRILNGGSEVRHVHHLHGGGIRWRFQPEANRHDKAMYMNLTKFHGNETQAASQRLDSQGLGPGETYTNEIACGGGGCQRAAGDFLFHCHVADHYVGGMWTFWRNYDTLQDDLAQLPDREGTTPEPVNSTELLGTTLPDGTTLTASNIDEWVEAQLPAQGVPEGYDATVYDWAVKSTPDGPLYLGAPLDTKSWPNYDAGARAGDRPEILFNPENGRIAYPLLEPHLGKRPPFAPGGHGPAPYLSRPPDNFNNLTTNSDHATIRADPKVGEDQLCPAGSTIKRFNVVAINKTVNFNDQDSALAEIFVLAENRQAIQSGEKKTQPLVYRANVGDCVTLTLTSTLADNDINNGFSKVNIHPHFIQFDVQASDGVITGRNYETSVRNFKVVDTQLANSVTAGKKKIKVDDASKYHEGTTFAVGLGTDDVEVHRIAEISETSNTITFEEPLVRDHPEDTYAGVEFVRYKYFVDANFGTVFFHDHVNAIHSFPRGLVGALVVEPKNSTYHDPQTGEQIRSGAIADIRTNTSNRVSRAAGSQGESFREAVMLLSDNRKEDLGVGSWINLRAEPFDNRDDEALDLALSSVTHGDPSTPIVRAYEGDPVVFRTLDTAADASFSFRVTGHDFRLEHFPDATPRQTIHLGPSQRFDLMIDGGAGQAGDYLYYVPQSKRFHDGMWGVFRVYDKRTDKLQPLPDRPAPPTGDGFPNLGNTGDRPPQPNGPGDPCPADAPVKTFDVTAMRADVVFDEESGLERTLAIFARTSNVEAIEDEEMNPKPLVMRAAVGECLEVTVQNGLGERVSLHFGGTEADPQRSLGITVGYNYDQSVPEGDSRTYRVYVDENVNAQVLADFAMTGQLQGDDVHTSGNMYGLYGAIVTAPAGSTFHDPVTGEQIKYGTRAVVDTGDDAYRSYVLLFQEQDAVIGTHEMPYKTEADGVQAINYRSEPFEERLGDNGDLSKVFDSGTHGDPDTPILGAYEGDDVRIHAIYGFGFQTGVFAVDGHSFEFDWRRNESTRLGAKGFGPHEVIEVELTGGAGQPGDYLYSNHRMPFQRTGQWGILRVYDDGEGQLMRLCEFTGSCT